MTAEELSAGAADPAFAELSRIVFGEHSLQDVLEIVAGLAKRVLPAALEASVTLINDDAASTAAFTGQVAMDLDERQYDADHGPCIDAARGGQRMLIADMDSETRWPAFAKDASASGIGSSLSIPIPVQREITGALNLYAVQPNAFDEQSVTLAESFAGYAAVAIANAHLFAATEQVAHQMQEAMASRAVIEQAKGILIAQRHCT